MFADVAIRCSYDDYILWLFLYVMEHILTVNVNIQCVGELDKTSLV